MWLTLQDQFCGELDKSPKSPPDTFPHGSPREVARQRSPCASEAKSVLETHTTRSPHHEETMVIRSAGRLHVFDDSYTSQTPHTQLSRTSRQHTQHASSAQRA